jgi:RNA-binding protein
LRLSGKQKRYLKGLAQNRKAVVTVGSKGLAESVMTEIDEALTRHELLKIKLPALPREDRERLLASICNATGADQVQSIGRVGILFRAADPPGIDLP